MRQELQGTSNLAQSERCKTSSSYAPVRHCSMPDMSCNCPRFKLVDRGGGRCPRPRAQCARPQAPLSERRLSNLYVFDHALAQWTDGLLAHRGAPVLRWRFWTPSILKTGHRSVTASGLLVHMHPLPLAPAFARSALPRKRVRSLTPMYGPAVRCKRVSSTWRMCGLASMYPASDWSGLSSGPSWISARGRSH